jgi:hypothetical protein
MTLPHKPRRSRKAPRMSTRRSGRDLKNGEVSPPRIFVEVLSNNWGDHRHAPAKIRVRRGCYRYLVWRDGLLKREFYLGKIKNLAPQIPRAAAPGAVAAAVRRQDPTGVRK